MPDLATEIRRVSTKERELCILIHKNPFNILSHQIFCHLLHNYCAILDDNTNISLICTTFIRLAHHNDSISRHERMNIFYSNKYALIM